MAPSVMTTVASRSGGRAASAMSVPQRTASTCGAPQAAGGATSATHNQAMRRRVIAALERLGLREVGADRFHVHCIERLARGHEQAVAARAAEANVCARFWQADRADACAVRGNHLDARPRARPDVAVHVAADAVRGRGRAGAGHVELDESLAVAE